MEITNTPAATTGHQPRLTWQRFAAPSLAVVAAVAGVGIGRLAGEPGSGAIVGALLLLIALASMGAWLTARPAPDVLRSSGRDALRSELDRARRHRRTFAMARLELADPAGRDGASNEVSDGIAAETIRLIGASLRITDRAWLDDGEVMILLPESDRATAEGFAARLRSAAPGRFGDRIGIACFPDDGLTSGALIDALDRGMNGGAMPSPLVRTTAAAAVEPVESGIG